MSNAGALVKKGLLWAVCCGVFASGAFAGKPGTDHGGDALKSTISVTQCGSPVPGIRVKAYNEAGRRVGRVARTNSDGIAAIKTPADKNLTFSVTQDGFTFSSDPLKTPAAATIELPKDSSLTLTELGQMINHARIRILGTDGTRYKVTGKTYKNGCASVTIPAGMEFQFEIKVGKAVYLTPIAVAPAQVKFDTLNTAPVATDLEISTVKDTPAAITLAATDVDNNPLTYTYTQPTNGTLTGTAPNLTYTPNPGFSGSDSFAFTANDGIVSSNTATATITVVSPFIISVNADNGTFTIPLKPGLTYDFVVAYDGQTIQQTTDSDLTLTFPSGPGIYDVAIAGIFPAIFFNNAGDKAKVLDIKQWGTIAWQTMEGAFAGCQNLQVSATDTPDVSNVNDMESTFSSCKSLTSMNVTGWDVSNVITMKHMFSSTGIQELDVSTWDTGSVESFYRTFAYTNMKLIGYENWDVSNVNDLMGMFQGAKGMTTIDISNWNTSDKLINIRRMFAGTTNATDIMGLKNLNVSKLQVAEGLVNSTAFRFTTEQYDTLLIAWAAQVTEPASAVVTFQANGAKYTPFSAASAARDKLHAFNWRIDNDSTAAGVDTFAASSITSPVRISGWNTLETSAFTVTVDGTAQTVTKWGDTLWYTDISLSTSDAVTVTVSYNDTVVKSSEITWTPTLIDEVTSQDVTIRKDRSLLLGSTATTGTLLEIDTDGDGIYDLKGAPGDLFPVAYTEYGAFDVYARIDGIDAGMIIVNVPEIHFPQHVACEIGYTRELTVSIPEDSPGAIVFTALNSKDLQVTKSDIPTLPGIVKLRIKPLKSGTPTILAKDSTTATVLENKVVDEFRLGTQATRFIGVVDEFEDGSLLVRTNLEMIPKVDDLIVQLDIFKAGVTFDDSSMGKTINTTAFELDAGSGWYLHPYQLIVPPNFTGGPCHFIRVYQHGVQIGQ